MRYFLDTHIFLWWTTDSEPTRLSKRVFSILEDGNNIPLISMATIWEIQIKLQLGKLSLPAPLPVILDKHRQVNRIELVSIQLDHILALGELPDHHRDPFDRLLIAQAKFEDVTILSKDSVFTRYPISVIW